MPNITKRFVETLPLPTKGVSAAWDDKLKGFGVLIRPSGRATYCLQYRNAQRVLRRLKIGVHGQMTTDAAREKAKQLLGHVSAGGDPLVEQKSTQTLVVKGILTLTDLARQYLERHAVHKRPKSVKEDKRLLAIILKALGKLPLKDVTRRDIEQLHLSQKKTPYQGNRILALLSKMFTLGGSWGVCGENPVLGIPRFQEQKKERALCGDEIQKLWSLLDGYAFNSISYVIKLLILTGSRKGELLNATWDQFDLTKGVWTKPSHLTKQKKTERLPLSKEALEILTHLKRKSDTTNPFVFPGRVPGKPLREIKTFWAKITKEAGLEDVRIHDLRHTYASHLVSKGLSLSIVGKLLGHTQAATTQRYAHLQDEPLRAATEMFGSVLKEGKKIASS